MKPMGEQNPLSQQPLISSSEFNLGDRESMSQMQRTIHVGKWEISEPLGELFSDLSGREARELFLGWCVHFEDSFICPSFLVFLFQGLKMISFARLSHSSAYDK